jgi:putative membrane protein
MVLVDIFIEMVAARLDYWHWDGGIIPLQNYIAWLIISFFFNLIYQTINFKTQNKIASTVFVLQLLFFFGLSYKSSIEKINKKSASHINFKIKKSKK